MKRTINGQGSVQKDEDEGLPSQREEESRCGETCRGSPHWRRSSTASRFATVSGGAAGQADPRVSAGAPTTAARVMDEGGSDTQAGDGTADVDVNGDDGCSEDELDADQDGGDGALEDVGGKELEELEETGGWELEEAGGCELGTGGRGVMAPVPAVQSSALERSRMDSVHICIIAHASSRVSFSRWTSRST